MTLAGQSRVSSWGWAAIVAPVLAVAVCILFPGVTVISGLLTATPDHAGISRPITSLWTTIAYAGAISLLASLIAWPVAWATRRSGGGTLALLVTPLLLPAYLAYAGWGLVRAPMTPLGDWLARLPTDVNAPVIAGRIIAVVGLALWAWPIPALIMRHAARCVSDDLIDAFRLENRSPARRERHRLRLIAPHAAIGFSLTFLVMMGSAVPLHVAQVPTYAINIWLLLSTSTDATGAWIASWPLIAVAAASAVALANPRIISRWQTSAPTPLTRRRAGWATLLAVWTLSVLVPLALFATAVKPTGTASRTGRFLELSATFWSPLASGTAIVNSAGIALAVGTGAMLIGGSTWLALSGAHRRRSAVRAIVAMCMLLFLLGALIPGVLVGQAHLRAWLLSARLAGVIDGPGALILAHLTRFGFIALASAIWLDAMESSDERDLRRIDGALNVRGWIGACLPGRWTGCIGASIAVAILSFHEIEAAVMVAPPIPLLAQQLLESLHFARDERLAIAAIWLMGIGVITAFAAASGMILATAPFDQSGPTRPPTATPISPAGTE